MSINLQTEATLSLAAAARMIPSGRRGRPCNLSTIFRWIIDGVRLPSGEVVRLEAVRLGGRWLTSAEAIQRFADRHTPEPGEKPLPTRTPNTRGKAATKAGKELERAGL
jgi:hypothetical protein